MTPIQRLREFAVAARELERNRFALEALSGILHMDVAVADDGTEKLDLSINEFDMDALKSYLVTFRRFTLQSEPCYLPTALRDSMRLVRGCGAERWFRLSKRRIRHACDAGSPTTNINLHGLKKPIDVFNAWIYAHPGMFHRNEHRTLEWWEKIERDPNMTALVTAVSLQFIRKVSREVRHLSRLIERFVLPNAL